MSEPLPARDDLKPGNEWIVHAEYGLQAKPFRGGSKSVQIAQNERVVIIHGEGHRPGKSVSFSARDVNDETKTAHYWCYLHEFQKRCKLVPIKLTP